MQAFTKLEDKALTIDGTMADYILIKGHLVIKSGKDGTLAVKYDRIEGLLKEISEIANVHSDFLKGIRIPCVDRKTPHTTANSAESA